MTGQGGEKYNKPCGMGKKAPKEGKTGREGSHVKHRKGRGLPVAVILALLLALGLMGCKGNPQPTPTPEGASTPGAVEESPLPTLPREPMCDLSLVVRRADGQVIPGLTVTVSQDGETVASATVDDRGVCDFGPLPLGEYTVTTSEVFLYQTGAETFSLTEDGAWVWKSLFLELETDPAPSVLARLEELQEQFPAGKYWNHRGVEVEEGQEVWHMVTDTPCTHGPGGREPWENTYYGVTSEILLKPGEAGIQCLGFASMISDQIFGAEAPIRTFQTFDDLRVGDQIRLTGVGHSMVVIEKGEDHIAVAEVNADYTTCIIAWGRVISKSAMEGYGEKVLYMTRYPD